MRTREEANNQEGRQLEELPSIHESYTDSLRTLATGGLIEWVGVIYVS